MNSGRITALAINPNCVPGNCQLWVGAAGGGVWCTGDALASAHLAAVRRASTPNAIGSLAVDPNDPSGNTIYAGTGEPNGSGDSEAGVGLFTSHERRRHLDARSRRACRSRRIARSDRSRSTRPTPNHYFLGTDVARHGSSSANGGRRTPPGRARPSASTRRPTAARRSISSSAAPNPAPAVERRRLVPGWRQQDRARPERPGHGLRRAVRLRAVAPVAVARRQTQFHQVFATFNPADTFGDRTEFDLVDLAGRHAHLPRRLVRRPRRTPCSGGRTTPTSPRPSC